MIDPNAVLAGAAAAALFVWLLNRLPLERRRAIYGVGLLVAVLIYVAFAAVSGTTLVQELGGGLVFSAMAVAGMRGYPAALVLGWATHVWWDLAMHGVASPIAPAWYPALCVGFDLVVAGAIVGELVARTSRPATDA